MATYPVLRFGSEDTFEADQIRTATLVEEFDPMSLTLPISTLEVTLFSEDADFSVLNSFGKYFTFERKTPVTVYEMIDGKQVYVGLFFLDEWENTEANLIRLGFIDQVGLLDTVQYLGGIWLTPTTVSALLDEISYLTGVSFEIDPDIAEMTISGWLPICTCREAVQQIAFAAGGFVLSARQQNYIKISSMTSIYGVLTKGIVSGVASVGQSRVFQKRWRPSQWELVRPTISIANEDIGLSPAVTLRPFVSGVEVTAHNYAEGTESKELFNDTLPEGEHLITFNAPVHSLNISGGSIVESGANHVIVSVAAEGPVELDGQVYIDSTRKFGKYIDNLDNDKINILQIRDATLVTSAIAEDVVTRIYDYYQQRLIQKPKIFTSSVMTGDQVRIDTYFKQKILGRVIKMQIDLAAGFLINAEIVGVIEKLFYDLSTGVFATGQSREWQRRFRPGKQNTSLYR